MVRQRCASAACVGACGCVGKKFSLPKPVTEAHYDGVFCKRGRGPRDACPVQARSRDQCRLVPCDSAKKVEALGRACDGRLLDAAIDYIESKFAITGSTVLSRERGKGAMLRLRGDESVSFPLSSVQAATALAPLLKAATASAFGHGATTVVDPSVRKARELPPDAFDLDFDTRVLLGC